MTRPVSAGALRPLAYRISDVCEVLGLSRSTVYRLSKAGRLPLIKIGRRTLVRADSVEHLLNTTKPDERENP
jgi:excisionase family DNA binding protein